MSENLNFGQFTSHPNTVYHKNKKRSKGKNQYYYQSDAEKFCYDNDEKYCAKYGGLYQWHTMMALHKRCSEPRNKCEKQISGNHQQGICPSGWHIPSEEEWLNLIDYLGGLSEAGSKM